ncbi:MAG: twin-arginine translocase TatA/TatE family subunit [Dehalococcoidia bacterium]|nr:twin-arginine translocase TatA/TatE family subunit [Dehalococcoidia bacterium]
MAFPQIGPFELIILLVIVLLIFGPGKLPQLGQQLGRGIRQFRKAQSEMDVTETSPQAKAAVKSETPATAATPTTGPTSVNEGTPPPRG